MLNQVPDFLLIFDKNQDEMKNQCELAEPPSSNLQFHNFSGDIPDQGPPEIEFNPFSHKTEERYNLFPGNCRPFHQYMAPALTSPSLNALPSSI